MDSFHLHSPNTVLWSVYDLKLLQTLETFVELYLFDRVSLGVLQVVETGLELVRVDLCDLRESGDRRREEDEQACADECQIDGSREGAGGGDEAGALQRFERQRGED